MKDNNSLVEAIEDSFIEYLRIVSNNGKRPFVLNDNLGWVKTFPTVC